MITEAESETRIGVVASVAILVLVLISGYLSISSSIANNWSNNPINATIIASGQYSANYDCFNNILDSSIGDYKIAFTVEVWRDYIFKTKEGIEVYQKNLKPGFKYIISEKEGKLWPWTIRTHFIECEE